MTTRIYHELAKFHSAKFSMSDIFASGRLDSHPVFLSTRTKNIFCLQGAYGFNHVTLGQWKWAITDQAYTMILRTNVDFLSLSVRVAITRHLRVPIQLQLTALFSVLITFLRGTLILGLWMIENKKKKVMELNLCNFLVSIHCFTLRVDFRTCISSE